MKAIRAKAVLSRHGLILSVFACALFFLSSCTETNHEVSLEPLFISNAPCVRFAVIGDYGFAGHESRAVADLVKSWEPDFIITTGDNNYPSGSASTIDANIGQFYSGFIHPYRGEYGEGAERNRFFPSLGNHDWRWWDAKPYTEYFDLPGNERYYSFIWGPVQFFAVDSDEKEPDGVTMVSAQAGWLREGLEASDRQFKFVYMHHPPYSSGPRGSTPYMQWPFGAWGADCVLSGHDHVYERVERGGIPYFVVGLGGYERYSFSSTPVEGSRVRYNEDYGAMLAEVDGSTARFMFYSVGNELVESYELKKR